MRADFKEKKTVPLDSLLLDERNPRFGVADDQEACLEKMISFGQPFFALAKDIAEHGLTIDHVVVLKQGSKYVVKDGNRRVSALKLMNRPFLCADKSVQERFEKLARLAEQRGNLVYKIDCTVGSDIDAVNDYVFRTHTGENGGIGRKDWASLQQEYFQISIGEKGNYWKAAKLLLWAEANDLDVPENIAVTTLGRFFNAQKNIRLLGFDFDADDELSLLVPLIYAIPVVKKLIADISSGKVHVKRREDSGTLSMMSSPSRDYYIQSVRSEVGLDIYQQSGAAEAVAPVSPPSQDVRPTPQEVGTPKPSSAPSPPLSPSGTAGSKNGSIPTIHSSNRAKYVTKGGHPLTLPKNEQKLRDIYKELTVLEKCPVAGMMLVRAFVEGTFKSYVTRFQLARSNSLDSITIKEMLRLIKNRLVKEEVIVQGGDYYQKIEVLLEGPLVSVSSMQKYIHSEIFNPRDENVKNTWDEFYYLLRLLWEEIDTKSV